MGRVRDAVRRLGVVGDLLQFLWRERLWWLLPMLIVLVLLGLLIALGGAPAVMPFVYTLI